MLDRRIISKHVQGKEYFEILVASKGQQADMQNSVYEPQNIGTWTGLRSVLTCRYVYLCYMRQWL